MESPHWGKNDNKRRVFLKNQQNYGKQIVTDIKIVNDGSRDKITPGWRDNQ